MTAMSEGSTEAAIRLRICRIISWASISGSSNLRIIYGAEYLEPEHLRRLKKRGLNRKRNLALKEFSLGMEALDRFVRRDPLYRVHECVLGVLAMESEPVDPRL